MLSYDGKDRLLKDIIKESDDDEDEDLYGMDLKNINSEEYF